MKDTKTIKASKRILLVTPDVLNHDIVASTIALGNILKAQEKEVWTLTNKVAFDQFFADKYKQGDISLSDKVESKQFFISFPQDREISDVEIEKSKKEFKIVIDTKSGNLVDNTISFRRENLNFDLVILLGFNSPNSSKEFKENFQQNFKTKQTLKFHYINNSINTNTEYIEHASSLSEVVQIFAEESNHKLSQEHATYLLTGMLFNTQNFRINTDKRTIKNLHSLVNKYNARLKVANTYVHEKINKEQTVWFTEIFNNLETNKYFSHSSVKSNIDNSLLTTLSNEDKVPIFKVRGCKVALVTVAKDDMVHGMVQTEPEAFSALEITNKYDRIGDNDFVQFWTKDSEEEVIDYFNRILNINSETVEDEPEVSSELAGMMAATSVANNATKEEEAPVNEKKDPSELVPNDDDLEINDPDNNHQIEDSNEKKSYWEKFNLQTLPSKITGIDVNKVTEKPEPKEESKFTPKDYNPLPSSNNDGMSA